MKIFLLNMCKISFIFIYDYYYQEILLVSLFNCVCLLLSLSTVDGLDVVWCHFVWTHLRMSSTAALTARNKLASTDECKRPRTGHHDDTACLKLICCT